MTNRLNITKEDLQKLFDTHFTVKNVAKITGHAVKTIRRYRDLFDIKQIVKTKYNQYLTKEFLEQMMQLHKTPFAISKALDISNVLILRYLDKFSIPRQNYRRWSYNQDFFSKDTEETFYIAGFIAADGTISKNLGSMSITLKYSDKSHLELIASYLSPDDDIIADGYTVLKDKIYPNAGFTIGSKQICKDLKTRFNIVPNKTLTYEFPEWLKTHPLVNHFIRGYSDGDFSWKFRQPNGYTKAGELVRCTTKLNMLGTESFLNSCLEVFATNCKIDLSNKGPAYKKSKSKVYTVDFGGNNICAKLAEFMYKDATIFLPRKKEIAMKAKETAHHINRDEITKGLIEDLYEKLGSQQKVADELNYSIIRVHQWMRDFNIPTKYKKDKK